MSTQNQLFENDSFEDDSFESDVIGKVQIPEDATPAWAYIIAKVYRYLKIGPEAYRKGDCFDMPKAEWEPEKIQAIQLCFEQFMEGKGRSQERPIENVCVSGFYAAMATLHFEFEERETFTDGKYFIDRMIFKHKFSDFMPEMTIELFNKVRARSSYKLS